MDRSVDIARELQHLYDEEERGGQERSVEEHLRILAGKFSGLQFAEFNRAFHICRALYDAWWKDAKEQLDRVHEK
jgi:hypothetical protein